MRYLFTFILGLLVVCACCFNSSSISIYRITEQGFSDKVGDIILTDTPKGLLMRINLENLPAGPHGFHIHENPDCGNIIKPNGTIQVGGKAGGHFDPHQTHQHSGPYQAGHLGDLPEIQIDSKGSLQTYFILPQKNYHMFKNRSIIIHEFGDNYSDTPTPLGGGGNRIACGIIY